eukprot:TRINITY_DN2384_c0_g1_i3.p1 TRINITY_DN2384_c0_g1~~TRINITY_DN2384_c0_g1_i3.p1  ORF type:complete len:100 (+),score=7.03 TRINITY_DN2384_c0_g1_i3:514-813(+)
MQSAPSFSQNISEYRHFFQEYNRYANRESPKYGQQQAQKSEISDKIREAAHIIESLSTANSGKTSERLVKVRTFTKRESDAQQILLQAEQGHRNTPCGV